MNPDGTLQVPLGSQPTGDSDPAFSANGSKIVFSSTERVPSGSSANVYTMNADGSGATRLTTTYGVANKNINAAFDRNGRRIVFASSRDSRAEFPPFEIYIMDANGTNQTRLTTTTASELSPAFSPDGTKIAFQRGISQPALYTMKPDGSGEALLAANAGQPSFSPDGSKIAFTRDGEIHTMNADGSGQSTNRTNNVASDQRPVFSPDGLQIAFERLSAASSYDIYTVGANGTGQDAMNRSFLTGANPDWGPKAATAPAPSYELTVSRSGSGQGTVTSSPAGINCGSDCTETYTLDRQVTLTPTPSGGGQFSGWTGDCTGTGTCTVTMDRARFVGASFAAAATPPSASIDDVTVTEGNSGTVNASFTVTLAFASGSPVTVDYATADDSAKAPEDYEPQGAGTLTFAANETTKTLTVPVKGDTVDEPDERFFVDLANPTGDPAARTRGSATITDDDAPSAVSIDDVSVLEGNAGKTDANFKISLSERSGKTVRVDLYSREGTATANDDFDVGGGTVTFAPGETEKTLTIKVNGDTTVEPDETYEVEVSRPENATIADDKGLGTIRNDDTPATPSTPAVSIGDTTVTEGDSGEADATFTVSLSGASTQAVSVGYATADDTATAPADFTAVSGTVNFAAGDVSETVTVKVKGDTVDEPDERFFVNLTNPQQATLADAQGIGTITDDDVPPLPTLAVDDVTVSEGNAGEKDATFTVSLSTASSEFVRVDFKTADDTAT
ncbi:MAG: Calx-beta domain-containing protein, partial [Solirubrobacteraceae bacterium]